MKTFICIILAYLVLTPLALAQPREYFLPGPSVQTAAVILGGASAGKAYAGRINDWALRLHDILTVQYGFGPGQILLLSGSAADPGDHRISGPIRHEILVDKIHALKKVLQPGDRVFFFLLGHGTADRIEGKCVITGPDITGTSFARILDEFSDQDVVVVNTTSAGHPFCESLSGPGRVIISATRSRAEKFDTIFAQHFIDALDSRTGDRDKNRRVSMWEAFLFAGRRTEKWYADQKRVPTEHAVLDDNGDGVFSTDPDPIRNDGRLAQIAYLDQMTPEYSAKIPKGVDAERVRQLTAKIRELERSVFLLRNRKSEMLPEVYQSELETLLIDLARTSRKLRRLMGITSSTDSENPT